MNIFNCTMSDECLPIVTSDKKKIENKRGRGTLPEEKARNWRTEDIGRDGGPTPEEEQDGEGQK